MEVILLVKHIRGDAFEKYAKLLLGEVKHRSYYYSSKINLEGHSRYKWYKRPTIIFFDSENKNPMIFLETIASNLGV